MASEQNSLRICTCGKSKKRAGTGAGLLFGLFMFAVVLAAIWYIEGGVLAFIVTMLVFGAYVVLVLRALVQRHMFGCSLRKGGIELLCSLQDWIPTSI